MFHLFCAPRGVILPSELLASQLWVFRWKIKSMVEVPWIEHRSNPYREPALPLSYTSIYNGARTRSRTRNLNFTRVLHCQLCYTGINFSEEAENLTFKRCHLTDVGICCSHLVFLQVDITITTFAKNSKLLLIVIIDFISSHAPLERFSTSLHLAIWVPCWIGLRLCSYFLTFHLASSARQHIAVE